jgi:hypothetical protein
MILSNGFEKLSGCALTGVATANVVASRAYKKRLTRIAANVR